MSTESWSVSGYQGGDEQKGEATGPGAREGRSEGGLAVTLRDLAGRARQMTVEAGSEADRGVRELGEAVAGRLERVAAILESKDVEEFREEVKVMSRENPLLVTAGVFAAGILVSRVLKHSIPREERD
jgi:hypothetical protein